MATLHSDPCHYCGGALALASGPGRFQNYRGVRCRIPDDVEVRTCTSCARKWLNDSEITRLSESLEQQRLIAEGDGVLRDKAVVEISILGPSWSPIMRYRFYMDHVPTRHITVWWVRGLSKLIGTFVPPVWFLKLIGQIEE